jgi:hypothetical protein
MKNLSYDLHNALINVAKKRALKRSWFHRVSWGNFMYELSKVSDQTAMYLKDNNANIDQNIKRIIELYER